MKIFYFSCFAAILFSFKAFAQQNVNYDDVAVVVNMNDTTSQAIANYFQSKRHIPALNMIPVHTSSQEEINDSTFQDLMSQIQAYITANSLTTKLNYIVTTKGCPLKVLRANPDTNNCNSSVESELMLLTPKNQGQIGSCVPTSTIDNGTFFSNPFFQHSTFQYAYYNIYLVTRLDAYTEQEVFNLIDRSGPNTFVNKDSVLFVLDQSPNFASQPLNSGMGYTDTLLTSRGWHVLFNTDSVFVTNQRNVIGYYSWGSNDGYSQHYTQNAIPHFTWANGSIAETGVSTSGRSFQPGTQYGQSLIADLLDEGCTGAKGYVYEPFTVAIANTITLFGLYSNLTVNGIPQYNLAESYFGASRMIGWMDVVIGDPKTSITTDISLANGTKEIKQSALDVFPNPATATVYMRAKTTDAGIMKLDVFDMLGQEVFNESFSYNGDVIHNINVEQFANGIYAIRLQSGNNIYSSKISVIK